jgi:EAL domain-containing protein (putative c-di-GMP-specific phosphodiesterase class I)
VAEFVETEATADCLGELGVKWMQGYLHARPQPLEALLASAAR